MVSTQRFKLGSPEHGVGQDDKSCEFRNGETEKKLKMISSKASYEQTYSLKSNSNNSAASTPCSNDQSGCSLTDTA